MSLFISNFTVRYYNSDHIYLEGSLRYSDYLDKDGNPRTKTEIHQSKCCYSTDFIKHV